jgi:hypothetical protein
MVETGWDAGSFMAGQRAEESPLERASRLARRAAERADRDELQDEAERAAAAEERREETLLRYAQCGMAGRSHAEVIAEASRMGDEDAAYGDAMRTIERIDRRRASRQAAMRAQAEQMAAVSRAGTGQPPGISHANRVAARMRVDALLAAPRRPVPAPVAVRSASRPFGGSGGRARAGAAEGPAELMRLGRGESSRGGCPPCDGCCYVICRCGQPGYAAGAA